MSKEDFLQNDDAQTRFIDRIAAFLSITFDRIRIVGIRSVSRRVLEAGTTIDLEILPEIQMIDPQSDGSDPNIKTENTAVYDSESEYNAFNLILNNFKAGV